MKYNEPSLVSNPFIKHYLLEMRIINQSPTTIRVKRLMLNRFNEWCNEHDIDLLDVSSLDIKEWITEKQGKIKASTINSNIKYLRSFYEFLVNEGELRKSPMEKIKLLKQDVVKIKTYSKNGVKKMLNYYRNDTFIGARNRLILLLLASTGMRNMSLRDIRLNDIKDDYMTIRAKGNKEYIVPLALMVQKQILIYLKRRNQLNKSEKTDHLIISYRGTGVGEKLIVRVVQEAGKNCGISEELTCHQFRRWFAQTLIADGVSVYEVSRLLNHSNISTTQLYLNSMQDESIVNKANKHNPINNLF